MAIYMRGVMRGKRIELDGDPGIPDGSAVEITIETPEDLPDLRSSIAELCGAWRQDQTLDATFQDIEARRLQSGGRPIDFDAAS